MYMYMVGTKLQAAVNISIFPFFPVFCFSGLFFFFLCVCVCARARVGVSELAFPTSRNKIYMCHYGEESML